MNSEQTIKRILLVIITLIFVVLALYFTTTTAEFGERGPSSFAELGGEFTLQTEQGEIALSDYEGQLVLLYFGFLNCPDVCPNSMLTMASALKKLPADLSDQVQIIMVSVDPERDQLADLAAFANFYGDQFIGATGSAEQLMQIADQYAAYFEVLPDDNQDDYEVSHSSRYYVINPEGQLKDAMRHSTTANELAARIRQILEPQDIS